MHSLINADSFSIVLKLQLEHLDHNLELLMLLSPADVPNNASPDNDNNDNNDDNATMALFNKQSYFALPCAIAQSSAGVDGVLG